jgi:hypothetical protein
MFINNVDLKMYNEVIDYFLYDEEREDKTDVPNYYYWNNLMFVIDKLIKMNYKFILESLTNGVYNASILNNSFKMIATVKSKNAQFAIYLALLNLIESQL